eukprot:418969_1
MTEEGSSNGIDCLYIPEIVIGTIILNTVLSIITLIISIISLAKVVKCHNTTKQYSNPIYYSLFVFYITCGIISICRIPDIIACNYFPQRSTFHVSTMTIMNFGYIYHWIAFLSLLYFRLKYVFKDSVYAVSKCYNCTSQFIICLLSIIFPLIITIVGIVFGTASDLGLILGILLFLIAMIFSQILAFTLIYKLYKLNKLASIDNTNDRLVSTMTKYTLLALISMIGTVMYIIILVSGVNKSYHSSMKYLVTITSNQLDVFIDTISVSLTLSLYNKYYDKLCIKCDTECKQCCLLLTNNSRAEKHLAQSMSNMPAIKEQTMTNSTVSIDNN